MWRTVELRWWWKGDAPDGLADWVLKGVAPLKDFRTDLYLADPAQTDLGIKRRARDVVEVKVLTGLPDVSLPPAMDGQAEEWVKVPSAVLPLADEHTLAVGKQRRRRVLSFRDGGWHEEMSEDEAGTGLAVEISTIEANEENWTTVCLEAFGGDAAELTGLLQSGIALFGAWPDGVAAPDIVGGYPLWLGQIIRD